MTNEKEITHPSHYTDGKIEVIDYILDKGMDFCAGNVVKYISRAGKKKGSDRLTDLKKARQYVDFLIESEVTKQNELEKKQAKKQEEKMRKRVHKNNNLRLYK